MGIRRCDLLCYSLGGFIALSVAFVRPDLIRKIILVGTAPQGTTALHSFPQLVEKAFQLPRQERFLFLFATSSERSRAKLNEAVHRLMERTEDRDREATMPTIQSQIKALTRWGTDPPSIDLKKIRQPVLVIQGSNDEMMDSASSLDLYRNILNSMLVYYPDSAHGSFYQYRGLFVEQPNSFLNHFE